MDGAYMSTAGFYNNQGFWTPHKVSHAEFELVNDLKDTYVYPVHGWTWYNSAEEAQLAEGFDSSVVDTINLEVYGEQGENNG